MDHILTIDNTPCVISNQEAVFGFLNYDKEVKYFHRVKYYKRDEFYAYDNLLREYLGEELYPDYLKY